MAQETASVTIGQAIAALLGARAVRYRILFDGTLIFLVAAILSVLLLGLLLFELGALVDVFAKGLGLSSTTSPSGGSAISADAAKSGLKR